MKYCIKCMVHIRSDDNHCPLCQRVLNGGVNVQIYPLVTSVYKQFEGFFKRMMFLTAAVAIITLAINALFPAKGFWALFVILGLVCFWVFLYLVINRINNIARKVTQQVIFTTVACVVWDFLTGWKSWSLDYVFPIVCVIAVFSMFILAKVMKLNARDYVVCLIANAVFGILPLIFYFLNLTNVYSPSIIGSALSLLSLVSIIIYQWETIRLELSKRFHL